MRLLQTLPLDIVDPLVLTSGHKSKCHLADFLICEMKHWIKWPFRLTCQLPDSAALQEGPESVTCEPGRRPLPGKPTSLVHQGLRPGHVSSLRACASLLEGVYVAVLLIRGSSGVRTHCRVPHSFHSVSLQPHLWP